MKAMAYVSITPLDKGESVSKYVSKAVKVIKESGLEWQLTPMGTIIAGENTSQVFDIINKAIESLDDCNRISISIKIDYRKNRTGKMSDKVESVMKQI
ncbi:MAG: hypothetical protein PWQ25_1536 [Deferribacteres bacterium]|jgi:uncharacterized protein (TIGR00106 family)|nr:family thiamine-binding protein [Deferribacteraceae bacterium]MDK2792673.1 hypothetical protein [Deferribacteres bacterium]